MVKEFKAPFNVAFKIVIKVPFNVAFKVVIKVKAFKVVFIKIIIIIMVIISFNNTIKLKMVTEE